MIISAVSFGAMPIFARVAYASGADPITVLFLRFGIAAVVVLGIMLASKTPFPRGPVLLELMLLGAIGYMGESLAYFTAPTIASAGLVALLLYSYPALVTALSAVFLKEHLTTVKIVALFLTLSGTALTIQISSGGSVVGILLDIAAAVDYAIYILLGSRIVRRSGSIGSPAIIIASTAAVFFHSRKHMTLLHQTLGEPLASEITAALIDLAILTRRAACATHAHLDAISHEMLERVLALCKARRGLTV